MFANYINSGKEVDLSHLHLLDSYESDPVSRRHSQSSFYLVVGLLLSIALHLSLLWWNPPNLPQQQPAKVLQLTITKTNRFLPDEKIAPVLMEEIAQPGISEASSERPVESTPVNEGEIAVQKSAVQEKPVVIMPLSEAELHEITQQHRPQETAAARGHVSENVFHPALHQRLEVEASQPNLQRVDNGPKTYSDPSRATMVDLESGKCLRSSIPEGMNAQNWYMTACGGTSESEQIMERVDQAVNGKLRFE